MAAATEVRAFSEAERTALRADLEVVLAGTTGPTGGPGPTGEEILHCWQRLRDAADGVVVAALPAFERSLAWAADGSRSPVSWMANHLGVARSAAGRIRRTSLIADEVPALRCAAASGALSEAHLFHLSRARCEPVEAAFDEQQDALVAVAKTLTADQLSTYLVRWRIAVLEHLALNEDDPSPGPADEVNRIRLIRSFQGRGLIDGELSPEAFALVCDAIDARIDAWRRSGSLAEDRRSLGELQAEALLELIREGIAPSTTHQAARPLIVATTDLDTLLDRADVLGEQRLARLAEVLGGGPVANRTIAALVCEADISLVVEDQDGQPLYVSRRRRHATHAQLRALIARSGGSCEWPGCDAPHQRCHAHHIQYWDEHYGSTDIDNLALLCGHHHRAVHTRGFTVAWDATRAHPLVFRNPSGSEIDPPYRGPRKSIGREPPDGAGQAPRAPARLPGVD